MIVDADRGEDLGFVHALGELAEKRNAGTPHGYGARGHDEEGAASRDAATKSSAPRSSARRTKTRAAAPWSA